MFTLKTPLLTSLIVSATTAVLMPTAVAQDQQPRVMEEILITVDRRERSLQDYAGTAQAFTASDLDARGVGSEFTNLQFVVPGATISNQEGNVNVTLRGVGSSDNTEIIDAAVANHLNGVYLPRARGIAAMFYDIERVEVNKGPQGVSRGRNATGGTINIVTKRPNFDELDVALMTERGSYDLSVHEAAVNVPVSDTLAFRAAMFNRTHDSVYHNGGPLIELKPAGEVDEFSGRVSALWNPVEAFTAYVVYDYIKEGGTGYPGLNYAAPLAAGYTQSDFTGRDALTGSYRGHQGELDSTHEGLMVELTYDFDTFTAQYTGSKRELDFFQRNAASQGIMYPETSVNWDTYSNQWWITLSDSQTHEIRFASGDDQPFEWAFGAFYYDEDQQVALMSTTYSSGCCYSGTEFAMPDVQSESTAVYGEVKFDLTDEIRLGLGVRYTEEEKSRYGVGGNYGFAALPESDWSQEPLPVSWGGPGFQYRPFDGGRGDYTAPSTGDVTEVANFIRGGVVFGINDNMAEFFDNCLPGAVTADCEAPAFTVAEQTLIQQVGAYDDSFVDYRVGVEWDLTADNLLYASIATGHKSGGFNDTYVSPEDGESLISNPFSPEVLTMYEIGSKNQFDGFTLNASLFHYDYDDYVLTQLIAIGEAPDPDSSAPTSAQRINAGTVSITGLELDGVMALGNYFTVGGNLLLLDAKFDRATITDARQGHGANPNVTLDGNRVPLTSEVNLNLFVRGEFVVDGGSVDFTLSTSTRSDYYLSPYNGRGYDGDGAPIPLADMADGEGLKYSDEADGYTVANFVAGYSNTANNFRIEAYLNNFTNEIAPQKALITPDLNLRFTNMPRMGGVRVKYNF